MEIYLSCSFLLDLQHFQNMKLMSIYDRVTFYQLFNEIKQIKISYWFLAL